MVSPFPRFSLDGKAVADRREEPRVPGPPSRVAAQHPRFMEPNLRQTAVQSRFPRSLRLRNRRNRRNRRTWRVRRGRERPCGPVDGGKRGIFDEREHGSRVSVREAGERAEPRGGSGAGDERVHDERGQHRAVEGRAGVRRDDGRRERREAETAVQSGGSAVSGGFPALQISARFLSFPVESRSSARASSWTAWTSISDRPTRSSFSRSSASSSSASLPSPPFPRFPPVTGRSKTAGFSPFRTSN